MRKILCASVLLAASLVAAQTNKSPAPNTPVSAIVVAKKKLLNQTATIPTTTIYTPTQTGLYRLSVYATVVASNGGALYFSLGWTDDSGPQALNSFFQGNGFSLGQFDQPLGSGGWPGYALGGPVLTFEAVAGQPIAYNISGWLATGTAYSLYYTLERVQ
jgi:hypothetical protein